MNWWDILINIARIIVLLIIAASLYKWATKKPNQAVLKEGERALLRLDRVEAEVVLTKVTSDFVTIQYAILGNHSAEVAKDTIPVNTRKGKFTIFPDDTEYYPYRLKGVKLVSGKKVRVHLVHNQNTPGRSV